MDMSCISISWFICLVVAEYYSQHTSLCTDTCLLGTILFKGHFQETGHVYYRAIPKIMTKHDSEHVRAIMYHDMLVGENV